MIRTAEDLETPGIRIGCVREGGAVDVLLHKVIDKYHLDKDRILNNIQRMNPPKQVLAIQMGQLDAAFLPEQWATMAEEFDFKMLLTSQEVWPGMQGSVLVVNEDLINNHPQAVKKLVKVTKRTTDWGNQHPGEAAQVLARNLGSADKKTFPTDAAEVAAKLPVTPEVLLRSMSRLQYTTAIDPKVVQETIDYQAELGYIKSRFNAEDILDLGFLNGE